jgi:hypothetical protein
MIQAAGIAMTDGGTIGCVQLKSVRRLGRTIVSMKRCKLRRHEKVELSMKRAVILLQDAMFLGI